MLGEAAESVALWPLAAYFGLVLLMVAGVLGLSFVLGQRHSQRATSKPYESGMVPTHSARLRLSADFYLVAVFFMIFDLETVFLFVWAVAVREAGWRGYAEIAVFVGVLLAGLAYLWRQGALDWGPSAGRRGPARGDGDHAGTD